MKQTLLFLIAGASIFSSSAAGLETRLSYGRSIMPIVRETKNIMHRIAPSWTPVNQEGDNVTFTFPVNTEQRLLSSVSIINAESYLQTQSLNYELEPDATSFTVAVNPGKYLIFAEWIVRPEDYLTQIVPSRRLLFKENVEIDGEVTINLDPTECDKRISFQSVYPDGTIAKISTLDIDPETMESKWILDGVNTQDIWVCNEIFHKDFGEITHLGGNAGHDKVCGDRGETSFDIVTNGFSDDIRVLQGRVLLDWGNEGMTKNIYSTLEGVVGCSSDITIINDPANYIDCSRQIARTPASTPWEERPGGYSDLFTYHYYFNNVGSFLITGGISASEEPEFMTSLSPAAMATGDVTVGISHESVDMEKIVEVNDGFGNVQEQLLTTGIKTMEQRLVDGQWQTAFVASGLKSFSSDGGSSKYPGNLGFLHENVFEKITPGNNAPIVSIEQPLRGMGNNTVNDITPTYIGRLGELRNVDLQTLKTEVRIDGETVVSGGYDTLKKWVKDAQKDGHTPGEVEVEFVNNNIRVDEIYGFNKAVMKYNETSSDCNVPSLEMLWFRDSKGNITDRFVMEDEGVIELAGADFNYNMFAFKIGETDVKVEYSAHGQEEWTELPVTQISDYYTDPGYGFFWRGSLNNIDGDGWFDVRVTLTDGVGNSLAQCFGPALFIQGRVSIPVTQNDGNPRTQVFTLDGCLISDIVVDLPAGIYIVKKGNETTKVIVK